MLRIGSTTYTTYTLKPICVSITTAIWIHYVLCLREDWLSERRDLPQATQPAHCRTGTLIDLAAKSSGSPKDGWVGGHICRCRLHRGILTSCKEPAQPGCSSFSPLPGLWWALNFLQLKSCIATSRRGLVGFRENQMHLASSQRSISILLELI